MLTMKQLFDKCLEQWGLNSQILMLAEECGELNVATLHLLRKLKKDEALEHFAEEIADVELMLAEIKYYFKDYNLIDKIIKHRKAKEERLRERLKGF